MLQKKLILLFSLLISVQLCFSQEFSTTNKKAIKLYQEADQLIRARNFDKAMLLLEQALEKDPNFVEAHLKLASNYKLFGKNELALSHYKKASDLKPDSPALAGAYFTVGELYFNQGDYINAQTYFDMVIKVNPNDKKLQTQTKMYLEKTKFGAEAMKNPVTFESKPMDPIINQFFIHAYPVLTADQQTIIFTKRNGPNLDQDEDIFISKMVNGKWSQPLSISKKINTEFNEGACTMSADGNVLVFTSCNRSDAIGSCDLYISYREGEEWTIPVNLGPNVNSNVWDSEPSISADGKTLYFSSERKGGYGKEDIWVTTQNERGEWSVARNLGIVVNTEGREVSPFIHTNGNVLYFSSSYHAGMGGFDIFSSLKKDSLTWSKPKNLGYPINTHNNDASVFISADGKKGYYSVYEKKDMRFNKALLFEFEVPARIAEDILASTYSKGTIYDAETRKKLEADIELVDLKTNKVVQKVKSDKVGGDYLVVLTEGTEYALYVNKDGYLFESVFFDYKDPKSFNATTLDVYLRPVKSGSSIVLNNIFFATNSANLEQKSTTELDKMVKYLEKNKTIKIELSGHTDDVGADKDNQVLSEKRARAVYDYLVKAGIKADRLKYKGYGETKPVAPNSTEESRQKNRRIEFTVISQ